MKIKHIILGILLVLGMIFCACEINKDRVNTVSDITVIANGSSEGIQLNIDNIPEDTTLLSVSLYDITTNDQLYTGAGFRGNELKQLRNAGILICPFVKNGHEYQITVDSFILTEEGGMKTLNSATTTAIASGGIYIKNNPILVWNNSDNFSILSERPVFSNEEINSRNIGFSYGLVFKGEEIGGSTSAGLTNELTFDNTQNHNSIVEMIGNIGLNGDIPMYANVRLTIEHEKIKWTVIFAKTEDITYSL